MIGRLGFSYIGLIYLFLLFIPNMIWTKFKPEGYTAEGESRVLLAFERMGEVAVCCTAVMFDNYNPKEFTPWTGWLIASAACMLVYEIWWGRYFLSKRTLKDFYGDFLLIPLPGATLPVAAFVLLGIYGKVIWLVVSAILLGIGHIGIHVQHRLRLSN